MSTHHGQAVTMASYERDNTSDPALKVLAYDIEGQQSFQIGEMQGWLDTGADALETRRRWRGWPGTIRCRATV